jgi:hypothetical protein
MGDSVAELPRRRAALVEISNMMFASFINDSEHWLQRAEQMRILADEVHAHTIQSKLTRSMIIRSVR